MASHRGGPTLALAAWTTTGQAHTALEAAKKYSVMREDMAAFGWEQPWRPLDIEIPNGTYAEQGRALAPAALARGTSAGLSMTDADLPALVETAFEADVAVVMLDEGFDGCVAGSGGCWSSRAQGHRGLAAGQGRACADNPHRPAPGMRSRPRSRCWHSRRPPGTWPRRSCWLGSSHGTWCRLSGLQCLRTAAPAVMAAGSAQFVALSVRLA